MRLEHSSPTPAGKPRFLTLDDAAAYLAIAPRTLRRMVSEGRVPAYRIGPRLIRFDVADLDATARPIPTAGGGAR